ncbi:MAG: helix-turn-helix transcriptional regulator [Oscillospiraceae bacterium]|nr:helix-turn-helix transcriptional regulator [Oscillospiraceae bacterium]
MDQEKIGKFIAAQRVERGLTQEALGERLRVSQRTISRWETGRNMPDISLLTPLGEELGVSVTELLNAERNTAENVSKAEASRAMLSLIGLAGRKRRTRDIVGAVVTAVLTLACMFALYQYEFCVAVTSSDDLESAIEAFQPEPELSADIIEWTSVGSHMFVLYRQEGHEGAGGVAELEKGLFGKYRVLNASNFSFPGYRVMAVRVGREEYFMISAINAVPGVARFEILDGDGEVFYERRAPETGFLFFIERKGRPAPFPFDGVRYYDENGTEIPFGTIAGRADPTAVRSGTGAAETFFIYIFEGLLLLLGIAFVRYFLSKSA